MIRPPVIKDLLAQTCAQEDCESPGRFLLVDAYSFATTGPYCWRHVQKKAKHLMDVYIKAGGCPWEGVS